MNSKHNKGIPNIISINEKGLDFKIKQNNKNRILSKKLIKKYKDETLAFEKEKIYKVNKFIRKKNKRQKIDMCGENKYLNFKSIIHIFTFFLLNCFLPLSLSYKTRKLYSNSIVNVFIKNQGNSKIISSNFQTSPDTIIINTMSVDPKTISYKFTTSNNKVQLIWENQL